MPATPFGANPIGATQFGNANAFSATASHACRLTAALPITFVVGTHLGVALPVTYKLLNTGAASVGISYVVTPAILRCAVNGVSTFPAPETITYTINQPFYDLSGRPLSQGFLTLTWAWSVMTNAEIAVIMAQYNPAMPQVQLTYPTEAGEWVTQYAMWQPPNLGTRTTLVHENVQLTFSHLPLRS